MFQHQQQNPQRRQLTRGSALAATAVFTALALGTGAGPATAREDAGPAVARGTLLAPERRVQGTMTSGSSAGGFAWTSTEDFEATVDCGTFEAHVTVPVSDRFTVSLGADGAIIGFTETLSAPRGVWTNMTSGASIVVRGNYLQVADSIPGTHELNRRMTGTRSWGEQSRHGATLEGGGQVVRDDSGWGDLIGHHHFADTMLTDPTPCAAIA